MGIDIVLYDTASIFVHPSQIVLGIGIPLFGGKGKACGDGCIAKSKTCHKLVGCACGG